MNYYEHHIGDYDADTAHLTWLEDMAYTRLMRLYYRREKPIPSDVAQACRLVRAVSKDERKAVESVLTEFFVLGSGGWTQMRCDAEIAAYQKKVEHNQRVGKLGGRPRKTKTQQEPEQNPLGYFREPEQNPPQTPDTRHHYSVPDGTDGGSPSAPPKARITNPDEIIFSYGLPMLTNAGTAEKQARSFLGGLRKAHGDAKLIEALRDCIKAKPLQPLEWLAKVLPPVGAAPKLNPQEALEASNRSVAERFIAEREAANAS